MKKCFKDCLELSFVKSYFNKFYTYHINFKNVTLIKINFVRLNNFHARRRNKKVNLKHILSIQYNKHWRIFVITYRSWHHGSIFTEYIRA